MHYCLATEIHMCMIFSSISLPLQVSKHYKYTMLTATIGPQNRKGHTRYYSNLLFPIKSSVTQKGTWKMWGKLNVDEWQHIYEEKKQVNIFVKPILASENNLT